MSNKFTVEIEGSEHDATAKLKAATVLMQRLTVIELVKLADVVKNDPVKTGLAKKFLGLK